MRFAIPINLSKHLRCLTNDDIRFIKAKQKELSATVQDVDAINIAAYKALLDSKSISYE